MAADGEDEKAHRFAMALDSQQQQQGMQEQLRAAQRQLHEMEQTWLTTQQQQQEMQQQLDAAKQQVLHMRAQQQHWDGDASADTNDKHSREAKRYMWKMELERLQYETVLRKQEERLVRARDLCLQWLASHHPEKETSNEVETFPSPSATEGAPALPLSAEIMSLAPAAGANTGGKSGGEGGGAAAIILSGTSASTMLSELLLPLLQEALDLCSSHGHRSSRAPEGGGPVASCAAAVRASQHTGAAAAAARRPSAAHQQVPPNWRSRFSRDISVAGRNAAAPPTTPAPAEEENRQWNNQQLDSRNSRGAVAALPRLVPPLQLMVSEEHEREQQQERMKRWQREKHEVEKTRLEASEETRQQRGGEIESNRSRRSRVSESSSRECSSSNSTPHSYTSNSSYAGSCIQSTRNARQAEGTREENEPREEGDRARILRIRSESSRTQDSYSSCSQDTSSPSPRTPVRVSAWRGRPAFVPRLNLTGEEWSEEEEQPVTAAPLLPLPQQQQEKRPPSLDQGTPQQRQQMSSPQREVLKAPEDNQQAQPQPQQALPTQQGGAYQQYVQQQQLQQEVEQQQAVRQLQQERSEETPQTHQGAIPWPQEEVQSIEGEQQEHALDFGQRGKTTAEQGPRDRRQHHQPSDMGREEERVYSADSSRSENVCEWYEQQRYTSEREQQPQMVMRQQKDLRAEVQGEQQEEEKALDKNACANDKHAMQRQEAAGNREEEAAQESPTFRKDEIEATEGGEGRLLSGRSGGEEQEQQPVQREQREATQHETAVPEEAVGAKDIWRTCTSKNSSPATFNSLHLSSSKNRRLLELQRQQQQAYQAHEKNTLEEQSAAIAAELQQQGSTDGGSTHGEKQQTPALCTAEVAIHINRKRVEATWRLQQQLQQQQQELHHHQRRRAHVQRKQERRNEGYAKSARGEAEDAVAAREKRLGSRCSRTGNAAGFKSAPAAAEEVGEESDAGDITTIDAKGTTVFLNRRERKGICKVYDIRRTGSDSADCCPGMCECSSNSNCSNCEEDVCCDYSRSSMHDSMCNCSSSSRSRANSSNSYSSEEGSRCIDHQHNHVSDSCSSSMYFCNGENTKNKCKYIQSEGLCYCSGSDACSDHKNSVRSCRRVHSSSSRNSSRGLSRRTSHSWKMFVSENQDATGESSCREEIEEKPRGKTPPNDVDLKDAVSQGSSKSGGRQRSASGEKPRRCPLSSSPSPSPLSACDSDIGIASPADTETLIYFGSPAAGTALCDGTSPPSYRDIHTAGSCDQEDVHTTDGARCIPGSPAAIRSHSQHRREEEEKEQQQPQKHREEVSPPLTEKEEEVVEVHERDPETAAESNQQQQQQQDVLRQCRRYEDREQQESGKPLRQEGVQRECSEKPHQKRPSKGSGRGQQKKLEQPSRVNEQQRWQQVDEEAPRSVPAARVCVSSGNLDIRDNARGVMTETRQQSAPIPITTADVESHRSTPVAFVAVTGREQLGRGGENQQAMQQLLKKSGLNPALILENRERCNSRSRSRSSCGYSSSNVGAAIYSSDTLRYALAAGLSLRKRPVYAAITCSKEPCCLSGIRNSNNSFEGLVPVASKTRTVVPPSTFAKAADDVVSAAAEHDNTPISRLPTTASTDEALFAASRFQGLPESREPSVVLQQLWENRYLQLREELQHHGEDERQHDHQQRPPKQQREWKQQQLKKQQQQKHEQQQPQEQQYSSKQKQQQERHDEVMSVPKRQAATPKRKNSGAVGTTCWVQEDQSSADDAENQVCLSILGNKEESENRKEGYNSGSCFSPTSQGVHKSGEATVATDGSAALAGPNAETTESFTGDAAAATEEDVGKSAAENVVRITAASEHIRFPNRNAVAALEQGGDRKIRDTTPEDLDSAIRRTAAVVGRKERVGEVPFQTTDRQENHDLTTISPLDTAPLSEEEEEADQTVETRNKWLCCASSASSVDGSAIRARVVSASDRGKRRQQDSSRLPSEENINNEGIPLAGKGCSLLPDRKTIQRRASFDMGQHHAEYRISGRGQRLCSNTAIEYLYHSCGHQAMLEQGRGTGNLHGQATLCGHSANEGNVNLLSLFDCKEPQKAKRENISEFLHQKKQKQDLVNHSDDCARAYGKDGMKKSFQSIIVDALPQAERCEEKKEQVFFSAGLTMITSSGFSPAAAPRTSGGQQQQLGSDAHGTEARVDESSVYDEVAQPAPQHYEIEGISQITTHQPTQLRFYRPSRSYLPEMPRRSPFKRDARADARSCSQQAAGSCCSCDRIDHAQPKVLEKTPRGNSFLGRGTATIEISCMHYKVDGLFPLRTSRSLSPCLRRFLPSTRPSHAQKIDAFSTKNFPQTTDRETAGRRADHTTHAYPKTRSSKSGALHGTHSFQVAYSLGNRTRCSVASDWAPTRAGTVGEQTLARCFTGTRACGSQLQTSAVVSRQAPRAEEHEHSCEQRRSCEHVIRELQCCSCCCSVKCSHLRSGMTTTFRPRRSSVSLDGASLSHRVARLGKSRPAIFQSGTETGRCTSSNIGIFSPSDCFSCDPPENGGGTPAQEPYGR